MSLIRGHRVGYFQGIRRDNDSNLICSAVFSPTGEQISSPGVVKEKFLDSEAKQKLYQQWNEQKGEYMEETGVGISSRAYETFESRGLNGQDKKVGRIKDLAAMLWDEIDSISVPPENSQAGRLVSLAKTELEASVMWAVKALSRNH